LFSYSVDFGNGVSSSSALWDNKDINPSTNQFYPARRRKWVQLLIRENQEEGPINELLQKNEQEKKEEESKNSVVFNLFILRILFFFPYLNFFQILEGWLTKRGQIRYLFHILDHISLKNVKKTIMV